MVQPPVPPPPPPAPAYQPTPAPVAYIPPPKRKTSVVWYIVGCGCLVLLLVLAAGGYFGYKAYQEKIAPELKKAMEIPALPTKDATPDTDPSATETPETKSSTSAPAVNEQPGKDAALKAALAGTSDWVGRVEYSSPDWQRVKVWVGPPESEFVNALVLQWDTGNNTYQIESTTAIPEFDASATEEAPTPVLHHKPRRHSTAPSGSRRRERGQSGNPAVPAGGNIQRW